MSDSELKDLREKFELFLVTKGKDFIGLCQNFLKYEQFLEGDELQEEEQALHRVVELIEFGQVGWESGTKEYGDKIIGDGVTTGMSQSDIKRFITELNRVYASGSGDLDGALEGALQYYQHLGADFLAREKSKIEELDKFKQNLKEFKEKVDELNLYLLDDGGEGGEGEGGVEALNDYLKKNKDAINTCYKLLEELRETLEQASGMDADEWFDPGGEKMLKRDELILNMEILEEAYTSFISSLNAAANRLLDLKSKEEEEEEEKKEKAKNALTVDQVAAQKEQQKKKRKKKNKRN